MYPSKVYNLKSVSACTITNSTIVLYIDRDLLSVDFFVEIINPNPYTFHDSAITGNLMNFGQMIQTLSKSSKTRYSLPSEKILQPVLTSVKLTKRYCQLFDIGVLEFKISLQSIAQWDKQGFALVTFPFYYQANLGDNIICTFVLFDEEEDMYCAMEWDWTLRIWGPRYSGVVKGQEFRIKITGVVMNTPTLKGNDT